MIIIIQVLIMQQITSRTPHRHVRRQSQQRYLPAVLDLKNLHFEILMKAKQIVHISGRGTNSGLETLDIHQPTTNMLFDRTLTSSALLRLPSVTNDLPALLPILDVPVSRFKGLLAKFRPDDITGALSSTDSSKIQHCM